MFGTAMASLCETSHGDMLRRHSIAMHSAQQRSTGIARLDLGRTKRGQGKAQRYFAKAERSSAPPSHDKATAWHGDTRRSKGPALD